MGWDAGTLMSTLQRERDIAVVLLRLGRFAVGVFRGTKLIASKTDTRYVKGKTQGWRHLATAVPAHTGEPSPGPVRQDVRDGQAGVRAV